jgi:hypothetical protein
MMRLIFIGQDCAKRIGGDAVLDVPGATIMDETPEVAQKPLRLIKLLEGVVTLIPEPPLTPEELATAESKEDRDEILRKIFHVAFNHENRIRVLEGKQPVTKEQFKAALTAL